MKKLLVFILLFIACTDYVPVTKKVVIIEKEHIKTIGQTSPVITTSGNVGIVSTFDSEEYNLIVDIDKSITDLHVNKEYYYTKSKGDTLVIQSQQFGGWKILN